MPYVVSKQQMRDHLLIELQRLPQASGKMSIYKLFRGKRSQAVKFWIAVGYCVEDMPLAMLCYGTYMGLIPDKTIINKFRPGWYEPVNSNEQDDAIPHSMYRSKFEKALEMNKSPIIPIPDVVSKYADMIRLHINDDYYYPVLKSEHDLSIRAQTAIAINDVDWLDSISTEPDYEFTESQLKLAAHYASIECFRFLSINHAPYSQTVLEDAMYGGNEEIIQMCLEQGYTPATESAMTQCIRGNHVDIVEWLHSIHGMEINEINIIDALCLGQWDMVGQIIPLIGQNGPHFWFCPACPFHPGPFELLQLVRFILSDPEVDAASKSSIRQSTNLILSCDDVTLANECGIDMTLPINIDFAGINCCPNILSEMTRVSFALNTPNPLVILIQHDYIKSALSLIEKGANITKPDCRGATPLVQAACNGNMKIVSSLIEHGSDPNVANKSGMTALMTAVYNKHEDIVKCLVDHGADVNAHDGNGKTALMRASCFSTIAYLVDHGADVNAVQNDGQSALLMVPCHYKNIMYLIEHGADVNAADADGTTPLMMCVRNKAIVEYLLDHGADVNACDKSRRSALMIAQNHKYSDTASYLKLLTTKNNHGENMVTIVESI